MTNWPRGNGAQPNPMAAAALTAELPRIRIDLPASCGRAYLRSGRDMKVIIFAIALAALAGCAPQQALLRNTQSGYPEETYPGTTQEIIKARLMDGCASRGSLVHDSGSNHVVCGKTMAGGEAVMAQLLVGNSYSTTPELKVRFTIFQSGDDVRVTAQQWIETQMAFGQMRRTDLNGNNHRNNLQSFLASIAPPSQARQAPAVASAPAPTASSGASAREVGRDAGAVEKLALQHMCTNQPKANRIASGPGYDTYSVACTNGDAVTIRCEFGNCRVLR